MTEDTLHFTNTFWSGFLGIQNALCSQRSSEGRKEVLQFSCWSLVVFCCLHAVVYMCFCLFTASYCGHSVNRIVSPEFLSLLNTVCVSVSPGVRVQLGATLLWRALDPSLWLLRGQLSWAR